MKYYNFILLIIILLLSCSIVAPQLNLEINGYNYEKSEYIKEYLPSDKEIEEQFNLKYNICPESFKTEWVIDRINYWISYYDFKDTNFHNLTDLYKNIVFMLMVRQESCSTVKILSKIEPMTIFVKPAINS